MKIKYLLVFLATLVTLVMPAGCGKSGSINTVAMDPNALKTVTDAADFKQISSGWAERLEDVAAATDKVYNEWSAGRIGRDEFAAQTRELYKETKRLKTESGYNIVFSLSESDRELVDYDLVTGAYNKALIQMNDFLYLLPTLEEEQVKEAYEYTGEIVEDELDNVKRTLKI